MTERKTSKIREKELRLAISRIRHGKSRIGETKITIAAVAREAGISTALIHNHYPSIAEEIRECQGATKQAKEHVLRSELDEALRMNRELRRENSELKADLAKLGTINEVLIVENEELKNAKKSKVVGLPSKRTTNS